MGSKQRGASKRTRERGPTNELGGNKGLSEIERTNVHPFRPVAFAAQPYRFVILGEVADLR
jgi:hypothetical protein